ncbi:MAG TPA: diguanylate cyclase, partial [Acidobacteriaceae bacterium]
MQLLAAVLALALCCRRSRQSPDAYFRAAWLKLGVAFCLWGMAQGYYLASILLVHHGPPFPSPADFLWLLFALPMLMVIVSRRGRAARWEWVQWLDTAQACTFFLLLFALVFGPASRFSVTEAYDVQSVALMLACLLRYSSTPVGPERVFFRNLGAYLLVYGVFSTLGNRLVERGMPLGSWGDLCWSTPLLSLCLLILLTPPSETVPAPLPRSIKPKAWLPSHVHGLSALALCLMSVFAAVALHVSRPVTSMVALALALILFAVRTSARESQLHYTHDTLQHSVLHDALTGLANRTCLRAELARALSDGAQSGRDAALLFIDLDRFKTINDGLGHAFGDRLLIEVAAILASLVRPEDLVVRLGGDEFVIMMEHADRELAEQMSRKVVERLREPLQLEGRLLHITASVGVVLGSPGMQPYDLLRDADCAMYVAKNGGKNQAQVFEQSMAQRAREELRLETDLREALEADDLTVAYQPIYSLER